MLSGEDGGGTKTPQIRSLSRKSIEYPQVIFLCQEVFVNFFAIFQQFFAYARSKATCTDGAFYAVPSVILASFHDGGGHRKEADTAVDDLDRQHLTRRNSRFFNAF